MFTKRVNVGEMRKSCYLNNYLSLLSYDAEQDTNYREGALCVVSL